MQEVSFEKILEFATEAKQANQDWHHHYLPPRCLLNESEKHAIVLDIDREGPAEVCYFDAKPLDKLELLENLFFNRS
jgi:hypothetical protein